MKAYNTDGLELHNVQVNAESGPAFLVAIRRTWNWTAYRRAKPLADVPVVRLDRCPGAIVRDSRAFDGTGTFLSVGPGELKIGGARGKRIGTRGQAGGGIGEGLRDDTRESDREAVGTMTHFLRERSCGVPGICSLLLALPFWMPVSTVADSGRQVFNIADYGAKKDGSAPATDAFRRPSRPRKRREAARSMCHPASTPPGRSSCSAT